METGRVVGAPAYRVEGRVEKPLRRLAQGGVLLVDQRDQAGPQRRGRAGAAGNVIPAVIGDEVNFVGDHGNVRQIAEVGRTLVDGHVNPLLPNRQRVGGADAPGAGIVGFIKLPVGVGEPTPGLLRDPVPFWAGGAQGRPPTIVMLGSSQGGETGL